MVNRAMFTELYAPGLRKVVFEEYTYLPMEYEKFCTVQNLDGEWVEDYRMAGFGAVPEKAEGTSIVYDDPVPGGKVRFEVTPFGKGFRITYEAQRDERYGQMKKMAKAMGRGFKNKAEIVGASLLNNAFTAYVAGVSKIGYGGFDGTGFVASGLTGIALCGTHTLLRAGTTLTNRATTDFGLAALQDALLHFEKITDESGIPTPYRPRTIVVGPDFGPAAREILGSQFKPYTGDNEINVIREYDLQLMVSHFLTDTNAWYVLADKSEHDLQFFWRDKFSTETADDFDTGDGKMSGYQRCGSSYGDWRGVWGSPGTT